MTAQKIVIDIMHDFRQALKDYGKHTYEDRGAREIMDLDKIIDILKPQQPDQITNILLELLTYKHTERLVSDLISNLDDHPYFEQITLHPRLAEFY